MRRSASPLSLTLLGIGVFLLVLAPMLSWYVEPRAKRTPIDIDQTTVLTGKGQYFDQAALATKKDQQLTVTRRVMGNVAESEKNGVAVWDVSTTIDNPDTVKLKDPRKSFQWEVERWVSDRETTKPVHCCGEGPVEVKGDAYLKFPFGVREDHVYRWWDASLGDAVPVRYAGRAEVQGYEGLRFTGKVEPTKADKRQVPGRLVGLEDTPQVVAEEWYANRGIELIVDQATGRILKATITPHVTLRAPGADAEGEIVLLSGKISFDTKTQKAQVKQAEEQSSQLKLVGTTAPAAGAGLGAALALAGGVLVVRGRREES